MKKIADCVRHALARAACRRAAIEQTSLRRQKKCAATPVGHFDLAGSYEKPKCLCTVVKAWNTVLPLSSL